MYVVRVGMRGDHSCGFSCCCVDGMDSPQSVSRNKVKRQGHKKQTFSARQMPWRQVANVMHMPIYGAGDTTRTFCSYICTRTLRYTFMFVSRSPSGVSCASRLRSLPGLDTHTLRRELKPVVTLNIGDVHVLDQSSINSPRPTRFASCLLTQNMYPRLVL